MIFTRSDGVQVDLVSGEVVGQDRPAEISMGDARTPEGGGNTLMNLGAWAKPADLTRL